MTKTKRQRRLGVYFYARSEPHLREIKRKAIQAGGLATLVHGALFSKKENLALSIEALKEDDKNS